MESSMFQTALIIGIFIFPGTATFDAPVTVDDDFVFSCLDSIPQPSEPLHLSGNWNADYYGSILPVYITVPGRPLLILFTVEYSDEVQGFLLTCTGSGTVTDSMPVYYWNSEGFESWTCTIEPDGRIAVTVNRDYDADERSVFDFNEDGSFTPANPPDTTANGSLEN
jgi:hypothetical protein